MTNAITVRPATEEDAAALSTLVCDVLYASSLADYGLENIQRVASHFTPAGVVAMLGNRYATYVAEADGRIVGTAGLDFSEDGKFGVVKTFFVDAGLQRSGIGALLYGAISQKAAESGVSRFSVRSSIGAIQFYEKMGFVVLKDHWDGNERTVEMHN